MKVALSLVLILLSSFLCGQSTQPEQLRVLSYNVYFDDKSGVTRYPDILKFIRQGDFNLIALQECTPTFLSMLKRDHKLRYFTLAHGSLKDGYTNVLLTSLKVKQKGVIDLSSNMGRSGPFIELADSGLKVVNVHLESGLFDSGIREQQLSTLLKATAKQKNVMIIGDMNFADGDDEESLLTEFTDLGAPNQHLSNDAKTTSEPQLTYDPEHNTLAEQTKYPFESSKRLDRIFLKCKTCKVQKLNVQQLNYSDHWPVSAVINN